jgi:hypothetical protein
MRRISPVLLLVLGSVVNIASGCSDGDEKINKPRDDTRDAGGSGTTAASTSVSSSLPESASSTSADDSSSVELPFGEAIGVGCEQDTDCIAPLTCLRQDPSFRGQIPGTGICTMPCTDDTTCLAVDQLGVCAYIGAPTDADFAATPEGEVPPGVASYCMQLCPYGDASYKCGDLTTFTCAPTAEELTANVLLGICLPLCFEDENCAGGEHCDTASGLCLPEDSEGKALADNCDPSLDDPGCAEGFCFGVSETEGFCSTNCNARPETIICGGGEPGPDAVATCYPELNVYVATEGQVLTAYGDLGQCWPLCDDNADCPAGLQCDTSLAEEEALTGRKGLCFDLSEEGDAGVDASASETTSTNAGEADAGDGG